MNKEQKVMRDFGEKLGMFISPNMNDAKRLSLCEDLSRYVRDKNYDKFLETVFPLAVGCNAFILEEILVLTDKTASSDEKKYLDLCIFAWF